MLKEGFVRQDHYGGIRSTVLFDPVGLVAHHWRKIKATGRAAHIRSRLARLREDCETHVTFTGR